MKGDGYAGGKAGRKRSPTRESEISDDDGDERRGMNDGGGEGVRGKAGDRTDTRIDRLLLRGTGRPYAAAEASTRGRRRGEALLVETEAGGKR
jgi:hypothetical protein